MSNKLIPVVRTECLITPDLEAIIPKECPEISTLIEFVESLPLAIFHIKDTEVERRQYDPRMLLAAIIYAFMNRIFSSRVIKTSLKYDDRFKYIAGQCFVSHVTICRFIQNNGHAISECMTRFLLLAMEKGLLTGENVGMDGTKLKANASLSASMTVEDIQAKLVEIEGDINACQHLMAEQTYKEATRYTSLNENNEDEPDNQLLLVVKELEQLTRSKRKYKQALPPEQTDQVDPNDVQCSGNHDDTSSEKLSGSTELLLKTAITTAGDPTTEDHAKQLIKLTHQKKKLERALAQADNDKADQAEYELRKQYDEKYLTMRRAEQRDDAKLTSVPANQPHIRPEPDQATINEARIQAKATSTQKVNKTDPNSRIMRQPGGNYIQGFNAQVITDLGSGFVTGVNVVSDQNDTQVMTTNITKLDKRLNKPSNLVADKGYANQYETEKTELLDIKVVTPLPQKRKVTTEPSEFEQKMTAKLAQPESKNLLKLRRFVTEGAFAQFKENLNFRKIYRRGLTAVNKEVQLLAIAHNFKRFNNLVPT